MTYFYKSNGTLARKIGGTPPADEYVAIDPQGILRHVKNNTILEEQPIIFPDKDNSNYTPPELKDIKEIYTDITGKKIAKTMLFPQYRQKKITKSKPIRKTKSSKKCKCK